MSVLIEGMEMPKPGQIVLVEIDENGEVFAAYDGGRTKLTQHKAVSVSPHGRLIDADKLMKRMWDETDCMISVPATFVRDAPTVIPASEVGET